MAIDNRSPLSHSSNNGAPKERGFLQVAATSNPSLVAGAIAGLIREQGSCQVQAIGAAAVNQSVKSIAIARGYLAPNGFDIVCVPAFSEAEVQGEKRTAIKFYISPNRT